VCTSERSYDLKNQNFSFCSSLCSFMVRIRLTIEMRNCVKESLLRVRDYYILVKFKHISPGGN